MSQLDHDKITASYVAGKSFGKLMYLSNPGWTEDSIENFAANCHPKSPMLISHWKQGFIDGAKQLRSEKLLGAYGKVQFDNWTQGGNQLPPQTGIHPEGENEMALTQSQVKRDDKEVIWADAGKLAANGVVFEITSITSNSEKWFLELQPRKESLPDDEDLGLTNIDPAREKVLMSLSRGARDADMRGAQELLNQQGKLWNCYVDDVEIAGGRRHFYDLCFLPKESTLYIEPPTSRNSKSNGGKREKRVPGMPAGVTSSNSGDDFDPFLDGDDLP